LHEPLFNSGRLALAAFQKIFVQIQEMCSPLKKRDKNSRKNSAYTGAFQI
jgi:hypothetical protein